MLALLLPLLSVAAAAELIITPDAPTPRLPACLREAYHGKFGDRHVYAPPAGCAADFSAGAVASVGDADAVVWVTRAGVAGDAAPLTGDLFAPAPPADGAQAVLQPPTGAALLHEAEDAFFMSLPRAALGTLDSLLPRHLAAVAVPPRPVPLDGRWDIPARAAKNLANVTRHLTFRAEVDDLLDELQTDRIKEHVRFLTGEASGSPIRSRHSMHPDARIAALYIRDHMAAWGFECAGFPVQPGFVPSVICAREGASPDQVVMSAHFDSRGSFGSTRAPGADDDASGSAHLLTIAEIIGAHKLKFSKTLVFAFFAGEEQGLLGSHAAAEYLARSNVTVALNVQADMLGYRAPGEPPQLGLPASIHLPEATWLVSNVSALYAPELVVGRTAACCSDHQSFLQFGFPATALFERNGPIADPMYHNSGDVSARPGYDFEQIRSIAKVSFATLMEVAGGHK